MNTTVLIAEDEPQARNTLRCLLEEEGYTVCCAANGEEASILLETEPIEAAIVDLRMPGKDGLALLREMAARRAPPAVLIMTAYGTSTAAIEAMKLGAFDYLTKPIRPESLSRVFETVGELRGKKRRAIELAPLP